MIAYLVVCSFLITLLTLFFLVAVLSKGGLSLKSRNLAFCFFSAAIAVWSFGHMMWLLSGDRDVAYFWVRVLVAGSIFVPYAYFHFAVNLTGRYSLLRFVGVGYLVGVGLLCFNFFDLIVVDLEPRNGFSLWPVPGPGFFPYLIGYAFFSIVGAGILYRDFRSSGTDRRNQLRYVIIGTAIGFGGGFTNFFLWLDIPIPPFGQVAVIFYILALGYSMVKFRTLDFSEMAFRAFGLVVISIIVSGVIAFGLIFLLGSIYDDFYPNSFLFWWVILSLLSGFLLSLGPSINEILNQFLHERFLSKRFAFRVELRELSEQIRLEADLGEQFSFVVERVSKVLSISDIAIYARGQNDFDFFCQSSLGARSWERCILGEQIKFLIDRFNAERKAIIIEEMIVSLAQEDRGFEKRIIDSKILRKQDVIVPIIGRSECLGFLILGRGRRHTVFSDLDLLLIENICAQLGLSMKFREMERVSSRVEKLVSLGTMAAGLSHELRNPLVSIRTLVSLIRKDPKNLRLSPEFSQTVQRDVKRIEGIVQGVSAFAQNTRRAVTPVNIRDVYEETVSGLKGKLEEHGIEVKLHAPRKLPPALGDFEQLIQVFQNIMENAIHAISEWKERSAAGRIDVLVSARGDESEKRRRWVEVEIVDNGPGISEELQRNVFDPFVTSRDTGVRNGVSGTGLGLAIVRKIIEHHDGEITVSSRLGHGARFIISLPCA